MYVNLRRVNLGVDRCRNGLIHLGCSTRAALNAVRFHTAMSKNNPVRCLCRMHGSKVYSINSLEPIGR